MDDRQRIVSVMQSWYGAHQGDAKHHQIIDTFNTIGVGKISYSDPWCAATTSAAYKICGLSNLFPSSASCGAQIDKAKKMGIWVEDDAYVPTAGDSIIFAWTDTKPKEDNTIGHDHTGIVEKVVGNTITTIEGNMVSKGVHLCGRRTFSVNAKNIRGYICPLGINASIPVKPESKPTTVNTDVSTYPELKKGDTGAWVVLMQNCLKAHGYNLNADGVFGEETRLNLIAYQKANIEKCRWADGICGKMTWASFVS